MRLLTLLPILVLISFKTFSQEFIVSENIADATGAVDILNAGKYSVQFTGNWGYQKDFINFTELKEVVEKNSLFLKFTATYSGEFMFDARSKNNPFQLFIFRNSSEHIVKDMTSGEAVIIYKNVNPLSSFQNITENKDLSVIKMKEGESILLVFNTLKKSSSILDIEIKYKNDLSAENIENLKKIVDMRTHRDKPGFLIKIRDLDTDEPVIASVNVQDKKKSNLYIGSDLYFNNDAIAKLSIKCDAAGYFFADTNCTAIPGDSTSEITIKMRSVSIGKVLKIDKIEFLRGTANLIPGTESILVRVKDFLVLNSDIRIEIQGHVNNEGKENLRTRNLSSKRAKTIMKYFIKSGINKKRMRHRGFGSDYPVYATPKSDREQQANRRVEIKIIE